MVVSDVDTRALVKYIREHGAQNAVITTEIDKIDALKEELNAYPSMVGRELASAVSTKKAYYYGDENAPKKVAVLDLGVKKSILDNISAQGVYLKVFPYDTDFETLSAWNPDGYFLSNGPGDPEPLHQAQAVAKEIIDRDLPLFGICLGHQVIALANGVSTFKCSTVTAVSTTPYSITQLGKERLPLKTTVLLLSEKGPKHTLT